ncbi:MAG TPA: hypothetical protein VJJ72_01935 [Candidatus Paceibacterota bacterium]
MRSELKFVSGRRSFEKDAFIVLQVPENAKIADWKYQDNTFSLHFGIFVSLKHRDPHNYGVDVFYIRLALDSLKPDVLGAINFERTFSSLSHLRLWLLQMFTTPTLLELLGIRSEKSNFAPVQGCLIDIYTAIGQMIPVVMQEEVTRQQMYTHLVARLI